MNNRLFITRNSEIKFFAILVGALTLLLAISFFIGFKTQKRDASIPSGVVSLPFQNLFLTARAVYVYDVRTGTILFAKNEDTRMPLASLTKIMSALVARDLSPMYGTVTISGEALTAEGDSGLYRDEKWLLKDILDFSLLTSSNDGMRAVALALGALSKADATPEESVNDFVGLMNVKAGELGLLNTYFWNETGLDLSDIKGGAYGSAKDMSILLEYVLSREPTLLEATKEATTTLYSLNDNLHVASNTNSLVSEIPGLKASKTGFTDNAGGNLVVIFDPELGRPIIITVLGSTGEGRFEDMRALVSAVMKYITNKN